MRKNQLIKLLQTIKGNPEIAIWNGFVEDYQQIQKEVVEVELYKLNFEGYKERVNIERQFKDKLPALCDAELRTLYKKNKIDSWEMFSYYPPHNDDKGYYRKKIYLLEPETSNKTTVDRQGSISY